MTRMKREKGAGFLAGGGGSQTRQIRNPNIEIRNNWKIRMGNGANEDIQPTTTASRFLFSFSQIRICFGFRISDFGFRSRIRPDKSEIRISKSETIGKFEGEMVQTGKTSRRRRFPVFILLLPIFEFVSDFDIRISDLNHAT